MLLLNTINRAKWGHLTNIDIKESSFLDLIRRRMFKIIHDGNMREFMFLTLRMI